jgi:Glutamine amidotransferase domain
MCGIAGLLSARGLTADRISEDLQKMTRTLVHRGPDDGGVWCDVAAGVGLGHRRLSIVDLSPLGHQPMASRSGRYIITFNGEIYNYRELRTELIALAHAFRVTPTPRYCLPPSKNGDYSERWSAAPACLPSVCGTLASGFYISPEIVSGRSRSTTARLPVLFCLDRSSRHCAPAVAGPPTSTETRSRSW